MTVSKVLFEEIDITPPASETPPANQRKITPPTEPKNYQRRYFATFAKILGDINGDAIDEAIF